MSVNDKCLFILYILIYNLYTNNNIVYKKQICLIYSDIVLFSINSKSNVGTTQWYLIEDYY